MSSENEIDEKIVLRGIWDISSMKQANQIPFNIDGTKCYVIVGKIYRTYLIKRWSSVEFVRGNGTVDLNGLAINLSDIVIVEVVIPVQI